MPRLVRRNAQIYLRNRGFDRDGAARESYVHAIGRSRCGGGSAMNQRTLFATSVQVPPGFLLRMEFIQPDEETQLLREIRALDLRPAKYKQFTARRRIVSYGGRYDFSSNVLMDAAAIPSFLYDLRARVAAFAELPSSEFNHAVITEYAPGTPLGWHRDVPNFEVVAGVSLLGIGRMRFRKYPPAKGRSASTFAIDLPPRSAYLMRGEARWAWQHSISPTRDFRYSITFRTLAIRASH